MSYLIRPLRREDGQWSMTALQLHGAEIVGIERGTSVQETGDLLTADHTHDTQWEVRQCDKCQSWANSLPT